MCLLNDAAAAAAAAATKDASSRLDVRANARARIFLIILCELNHRTRRDETMMTTRPSLKLLLLALMLVCRCQRHNSFAALSIEHRALSAEQRQWSSRARRDQLAAASRERRLVFRLLLVVVVRHMQLRLHARLKRNSSVYALGKPAALVSINLSHRAAASMSHRRRPRIPLS